MLLARPGGDGLPRVLCEVVQLSGLLVAFLSLATLGRSFGIVAANRGVKTRGPYRFVRHPTYMGYLICYLGYVAENPRTAELRSAVREHFVPVGSASAKRSVCSKLPGIPLVPGGCQGYRLVPSIY